MNFQSLAAIGFTLALVGTSQAQETPAEPAGLVILPGLYDVTVSQTNSAYVYGERTAQPTQTQSGQQCLELPNSLVLPKYFNKPGCTILVEESDSFHVAYKMNCQNGSQKFEGDFNISVGHWGRLTSLEDFTRLPDNRSAAKLFSVTGKLGTKTEHNEAYQESEMRYTYVGPCPK